MKKDELLVGAFLLLFGAVTMGLSWHARIGTLTAMGSGFFPFILGLLLVVLSCFYLARVFVSGLAARAADRRPRSPAMDAAADTVPAPGRAQARTGLRLSVPARRVAAALAIMAVSALILPRLGYLLSSFFIMAAFLTLLGTRKWYVTLALAAVTSLVSFVVFVKVLKVLLPKGLLAF